MLPHTVVYISGLEAHSTLLAAYLILFSAEVYQCHSFFSLHKDTLAALHCVHIRQRTSTPHDINHIPDIARKIASQLSHTHHLCAPEDHNYTHTCLLLTLSLLLSLSLYYPPHNFSKYSCLAFIVTNTIV